MRNGVQPAAGYIIHHTMDTNTTTVGADASAKMLNDIMRDIMAVVPIINRYNVGGALTLRHSYTTYRDVKSYGFISCVIRIDKIPHYNYPSIHVELSENTGDNYDNSLRPTPSPKKVIDLISWEEDQDRRRTEKSYCSLVESKLVEIVRSYGSINS